jgi:hypothetical protein
MTHTETQSRPGRIIRSAETISKNLGGEEVILDLNNGRYFGLDSVGARVWELIEEPGRFDAIVEALLSEFEVERVECERDLLALLGDLERHGLISWAPDDAPASA